MSSRYRFAGFTLSPGQRVLVRDGRAVPVIPRYLDLLLLLVGRRHQAVRALRRALEDDPRGPAFIRTVSRHGYQFVHPEVIEENDDRPLPPGATLPASAPPRSARGSSPGATAVADQASPCLACQKCRYSFPGIRGSLRASLVG
jgi:DNA-binding winged helix-turn-helix (wHTH) protein